MGISLKEIHSRLDSPNLHFNLNTKEGMDSFKEFVDKVEIAEKSLEFECEQYSKQNPMYPDDKDYIFQYWDSNLGVYFCLYKKMQISPS